MLIADDAREMRTAPWQVLVPAALLALTLFALNVLADRGAHFRVAKTTAARAVGQRP